MPLYLYRCEDCGARLEILHPVARGPERCGLDCQLKNEGSFGRGRVVQQLSAAHLSTSAHRGNGPGTQEETALPAQLRHEAMRREALSRMGGEVTEAELDKLRDSGMTVYRKRGSQHWEKDGGSSSAPREIHGPDKDSS